MHPSSSSSTGPEETVIPTWKKTKTTEFDHFCFFFLVFVLLFKSNQYHLLFRPMEPEFKGLQLGGREDHGADLIVYSLQRPVFSTMISTLPPYFAMFRILDDRDMTLSTNHIEACNYAETLHFPSARNCNNIVINKLRTVRSPFEQLMQFRPNHIDAFNY